MITIDFETKAIDGNSIANPPEPVGVSIKIDGNPSSYLAWGHPTGNNTDFEYAKNVLLKSMAVAEREDPEGWLAHNAAFECAVLRQHFGWRPLHHTKVHDTQYQLFLTDPYAFTFALKPSAERVLGLPPDEQTELMDWILRNVPGATKKEWGAHISKAPGDLVGKYAGNSAVTNVPGDTDRTYLLHRHLMPIIEREGMLEAYQREQRLMPILSASSEQGVRIDRERLARDTNIYLAAMKMAEDYVYSRLGSFNIDSDAELAVALDRAGMVTEWVLTPTGKRSTSRKNLTGRVRDPELLGYLAYRGILATCIGTFAQPWLEMSAADGRLHAQWNQVRGAKGGDGDMSGTRTGRMSCNNPNLTNIPNDFDGVVIPKAITAFFESLKIPGLAHIPHMRVYMLPEEGHIWLKRDFSAQEMRWMAHFAEGKLFDAFRADPKTDPHVAVQKIIYENSGIKLDRKFTKITGFGIMYGRGIDNLALALGVDTAQGKATRDAYFAALPEVRELSYETRNRGRRNQPITTWGGRKYYREPHPDRDLSYKLMNYLIQGSSADQTKESIIEWDDNRLPMHFLLAAVHDEVNISAPEEQAPEAMRILREAMNADRADVPFLSEGYAGPNWSEIESYE